MEAVVLFKETTGNETSIGHQARAYGIYLVICAARNSAFEARTSGLIRHFQQQNTEKNQMRKWNIPLSIQYCSPEKLHSPR
jgi:hypothetical protein